MKKFAVLLMVVSLIVSSFACVSVYADDKISITIDGKSQTFDQMPVLISDRTMVPMRGIFEAMGATVDWNEDTQTVTGTKGSTVVKLQIGKTVASVNGKSIKLDVAAQTVNDRTMVPVRFIAESLGCKVDWIDSTQTVVIESPSENTQDSNNTNNTNNTNNNTDTDSSLPAGGTVLISADDFYNNVTIPANEFVTSTKNDSEKSYTIKVPNAVESSQQTKTIAKYTKSLELSSFNAGDTFLITFKARLISGGSNDKGYIKFQLQNPEKSSEKSIFSSVSFGKEWTTCYAPFKQKANCTGSFGFRSGLVAQEFEIKDLQLINYGTSVKVADLPSSICPDPVK